MLAEWFLANLPIGYFPFIRVRTAGGWYPYSEYLGVFLGSSGTGNIVKGDPYFPRHGLPFVPDTTSLFISGAMFLNGSLIHLNGTINTLND
jgi:hypothetical protein